MVFPGNVSHSLPRRGVPKDLPTLLPFGVAQFATLLPPGLPTGPASDSAGIDLPLRHLEPPSLRLSGPHLRASTILALESLIPVPGVDRIGTVIRMLCHISADRIRRDYRHQIVPIVFPTKASIPNGRGARPCLAFFLRFLVDGIGHVCLLLYRHFGTKSLPRRLLKRHHFWRAPPQRASGELFFLLTMTYMEVGDTHPHPYRRSRGRSETSSPGPRSIRHLIIELSKGAVVGSKFIAVLICWAIK